MHILFCEFFVLVSSLGESVAHGGRHLCGVHLVESRGHHLGDEPVAGTQVQQRAARYPGQQSPQVALGEDKH